METEKQLSETLLDSLGAPFQYDTYPALEEAAYKLELKFQSLGYLDAKQNGLTKINDSTLKVNFILGNRWSSVKVYNAEEQIPKSILREAGIDEFIEDSAFTIPIARSEYILSKLTVLVSELRSDPFLKISLKDIEKADLRTLTAHLQLTSNKPRTINGIVVKGYEKFPKSFLKYYAGIKKGKAFRQQKLNTQNDLLDNLRFANSLKPPEALFKKDSTIVYFYLKKINNNNFDGILGFATNEETQKLELNGYLNLVLSNNLNFGEQLLLNYKSDGNDQQNFRAAVELPYILKSPFGVSLELKIFKRDSTFSSTEQQAKLRYQLSPRVQFYGGYKSMESSNLLEIPLAGTPVEDFDSRFFTAGGLYTNQQRSDLFPTKTSISLGAEFGTRELLTSEDDQIRLLFSANHIFNLNSKNAIYLNNTTEYLSSDTYITNELFRFGGINSIRGFNENSIDASLHSTINTEYRFILNQRLYIHTITDIGYFENNAMDLEEELYSFGFGMGLLNEAGLFRLSIANGSSKSQRFEFSNTKVHISFSTLF